jgi:hypothetical protein
VEELIVIASSTWKFAATFPVAIYIFKMSFLETILYTNIGGLLGIIVFAFVSKVAIRIINSLWPKKADDSKRHKRIFTKRNRRLIFLKNKVGLPGIIILSPVVLSIPVGVLLVTKYFRHRKINYLYLLAGQFVWSIVYTTIYFKVKAIL